MDRASSTKGLKPRRFGRGCTEPQPTEITWFCSCGKSSVGEPLAGLAVCEESDEFVSRANPFNERRGGLEPGSWFLTTWPQGSVKSSIAQRPPKKKIQPTHQPAT